MRKNLHSLIAFIILCACTLNLSAQVVTLPTSGAGTTQTALSGTLQDHAGDGQYTNSVDGYISIDVPCGLLLTFTQVAFETCCDRIYLYNGLAVNDAALILSFNTLAQLPAGGVIETEGPVTVRMSSDGSVINDGFTMTWQGLASTPNADFTPSDLNPPANIPVTFLSEDSGAATWSWDFGDGTAANTTDLNPVHSYAQAGTYTITFTALGCTGTPASSTQTITVQQPPQITVSPGSFTEAAPYGTEPFIEQLTICNTGTGDMIFSIDQPLISEKGLNMLGLINGADSSPTGEYTRTIAAINSYFTDYVRTDITTYDPVELAAALEGKDILLIPEQEDCNEAAMTAFAPILQNFAQNGGTIILIGTNKAGNTGSCVFNTGLLEGSYVEFVQGELDIIAATDPLLEGVVAPYLAQVVTYTYDITNLDFVSVIEHQGDNVVGYRQLGAGKVILIGHDYTNSNANNKRVVSNAVATSSQINDLQWLFLSENEGTLAPGECATIDVQFDATAVYGDDYLTNINITSNDSETPVTVVPANFNISGTPSFGISPASLSFDMTMTTDVSTLPIVITNNGTAALEVLSITSSNPAFTIDPSTFSVYGGGVEQIVTVNFAPPAIDNYSGTLTITTNVGVFTIPITGIGVGSPLTTVTPNPLTATINAGTSTVVPLTINNSGQGPLIYTINNEPFSGSLPVLIYTNGIPGFGTPAATIQNAVLAAYPNATVTTTTTTNGTVLAGLLAQNKVFIVPQIQDVAIADNFASLDDEIQAFANAGGMVIFGAANFDGGVAINNSGLFSLIQNFDSGDAINVNDENHPLADGITDGFFTTNGATPVTINNTDATVVIEQVSAFGGGGAVAAYRNVGAGKAVYIGFAYTFPDVNAETILGNAIKWQADVALVDWLALNNTGGTVGFPGQVIVDVNLDATNLLGGTYYTQIEIATNEPLNPSITVPVVLTVVGIPQIQVSDTSFDFGSVIIGNTESYTLTINNPGTDTLFISSITTSAGYTVSGSTIAVPPLQSTTVTVTFTPTAIQSYNGTLTINNNVTPTTIALIATGQGAPAAAATPTAITQTLLSGSQANTQINLSNSGAGSMAWSIQGAGTTEALVMNYGTTPTDLSYINFINNINAYFEGNINLTNYDGTDGASLAAALEGKSVLLVPTQQQFLTTPGVLADMGDVMEAFANNGGTILFAGTTCANCLTQTNMFTGFFNYTLFGGIGEEITYTDPDFGTGLTLLPAVTYVWQFNDLDIQTIATGPFGGQAMAYRTIGDGSVLYLGNDFSSLGVNDNLGDLINNGLQWATNALPYWLSAAPAEGNTNVGSTAPITVNFNANGMLAGTYTYTIVINTNDPLNPTLNIPVTLTVEAFPQAAFDANVSLSCDGSVQFNDASVNNPTSWSWNFGNGAVSASQNPYYIYETEGTYDVTLIACNNLGCDTTTLADFITVDFGFVYCDTTNMPSQSAQTVVTCHGVLRDPGGEGQYSNSENSTITIAPPGASKVTLDFDFITVETCCDRVSVYDGPTVGSPLIGQYTTDPGTIIESTGTSLTVQFTSDGSVINDGFEAKYDCIQITDVPNPDLDYEVISECLGQIDFADASDNYPDQWTWNFGDGSPTSNEQDPSHQYAQSGTYQVILQACNFLGCQTDTIPVTINNVVYANFAYNNGNPAGPPFVNQGTPIQFVDNTAGAISWVWTFGNGSGNQGNPTPVTFYTQQGTYTVTLEVTTASGCTRTTTQVIQVVATGINTPMPDAANVQLQPNPATDRVKVSYQFTGTETVNMQLFDAVGQLITSQQQANVSQQYQTDISLANLPKGVYFVTLQTSKGIVTKKLTIQ